MRSLAPISRRKIAAGILMFILLTVGGYAAVRWSAGAESESVVSALSGATAGFLVIAAALAILEFASGGARIWILARKLKPDFRWWDGVHVFLYLLFAAGLTPMQLGGGPAQYLMLRRKGLHAHDTLAVLSVNWVSGLIVLVTLAGAGLWYLIVDGNVVLSGLLRGLIAMMGNIEDKSAIGTGMATALLTTMYGAIMANMLFIPTSMSPSSASHISPCKIGF